LARLLIVIANDDLLGVSPSVDRDVRGGRDKDFATGRASSCVADGDLRRKVERSLLVQFDDRALRTHLAFKQTGLRWAFAMLKKVTEISPILSC